jgi:hypothetical protein
MEENIKVSSETFMGDLTKRVSRLEEGQNELIRRHYEFDKELSTLQVDLKYIREGLDITKGGINKLLMGVAGLFLAYIVGFIVSGGLAPVQ